jgi:RNA polymerase sigma-70 factor, ECF subfamily
MFGMTVSEIPIIRGTRTAARDDLQMDERTFHTLYERTTRPLWVYLFRMCSSESLADDLLQESYYRILKARLPDLSQEYIRNYLFRIATNLLRDHWRRQRFELPPKSKGDEIPAEEQRFCCPSAEARVQAQSDMDKALGLMKPAERELLWLAYVEGSSHREIAGTTGIRESSVRPLLFRARRKLADLLRTMGLAVRARGHQ